MTSIADLRPGDLGFGPIHGAAGALVNAGQLMLGEGFHVGRLDVRHVFVVTRTVPWSDTSSAFWAVEAMPNGAREVMINDRWTPEYAYVRLPEDYPGQAQDAAAIARAMIGTPYSFASYAALAAWRFGWKTPWLERWINRRRKVSSGVLADRDISILPLPVEAICSVLADQAWTMAGKQVMPAGTPHQCVTPGALAAALLEKEGAQWLWPGRK
jgi:hypothetical protein